MNPKFRQALVDIVREAGLADGCTKQKGNLLYYVASKVTRRRAPGSAAALLSRPARRSRGSARLTPPLPRPQYPAIALVHRSELLKYIVDERIKVRALQALQHAAARLRRRSARPAPPAC